MIYAASSVAREDWLPFVRSGLGKFEAFELACAEPRIAAGAGDAGALLRLKRRHGLSYSVHAPFRRLDIASDTSTLRRRTEALYARALDVAAAVEASLVVMHPCMIDTPSWQARKPPARRQLREVEADAFERLAIRAGRLGVRIGVENMPRTRAARDAGWLRGLKAAVPSEMLGFVVDVGHAHTTGIPPALLLRELGPDVYHVHVHDNAGDRDEHRGVGQGSIDWRSVAEALVDLDYRHLVADEAFHMAQQVRGKDFLGHLANLAGTVHFLEALPGPGPRSRRAPAAAASRGRRPSGAARSR